MIDQNKLKQDVDKWNKACRYLKNQESEMPEEEWSIIQYLVDDYLYKIKPTEIDQEECRKSLQQLSVYEKYHIKNREIITQERELKRIVTIYFLAGEEEFLAFKKAKGIRMPEPTPVVSRTVQESSAALINPGLLKQKAIKLYEAYVFFEKNMHLLEEEGERPAIIYLLTRWQDDWSQGLKNDCKVLIDLLKDSDRLHGNNRDIITYSKIVRDISYSFYCKDRETFEAFVKSVQEYDKIHPYPDLFAVETSSLQSSAQASSSIVQPTYNTSPISNASPVYSRPSIRIDAVEFASYFPDGSVMDNYGQPVFSDSFYLMPRIYFTRLDPIARTASIGYKLYNPRLDLCTTPDSSMGYTMNEQIDLSESPVQVFGFGSESQGFFATGTWSAEFYENGQLLYRANLLVREARRIRKYNPPRPESPRRNTLQSRRSNNAGTSNLGRKVWITVACVILALIALGGIYQFWYKDYKRDKDAPRYYTFTNLNLRSSQVADVDHNLLEMLTYGTELITYANNGEWAEVKANGKTGFVSADLILSAEDFQLMNSIWGNTDAKDCVKTAKCRLALLDYYKRTGLQGGVEWQLYTKKEDEKPNSVWFGKAVDAYSKFTDFAFVLKNNRTGERKFALYSFDDETEEPIFRLDMGAPSDTYIRNVAGYPATSGTRISVSYANGMRKTVFIQSERKAATPPLPPPPPADSEKNETSTKQSSGIDLFLLGEKAYKKKDYAAAQKYYKEAADKGVTEAYAQLGWMAYNGWGSPVDGTIAISYLKDAVELGNANACYYLGYLYEHGVYKAQLFKSIEQAIHYYKLGSDRGQADAHKAYLRLSNSHRQTTASSVINGQTSGSVPSSGLVFSQNLKGKSYQLSNPFRQKGGAYTIAFWTDNFSARTIVSAVHPDGVKGWDFPKVTFQSNGIFLLGTEDRSSVSYAIFPYDMSLLHGMHFICVVCDPSVYQQEKKLYIDGKHIVTLPNPQLQYAQSACPTLQTGSQVYQLYLYIRALSDNEIISLYQASH